MRTIVAHRVSTVVVNTVGNLSAVNIPAGSFGVVSTGNLNAMDILAGSLNAMDTRAGSSAGANIPAASTVGGGMGNGEGVASIETESERKPLPLTSKLSQSISATVASWATRIEPWFTSPTTQLASSTRFIARLS